MPNPNDAGVFPYCNFCQRAVEGGAKACDCAGAVERRAFLAKLFDGITPSAAPSFTPDLRRER